MTLPIKLISQIKGHKVKNNQQAMVHDDIEMQTKHTDSTTEDTISFSPLKADLMGISDTNLTELMSRFSPKVKISGPKLPACSRFFD